MGNAMTRKAACDESQNLGNSATSNQVQLYELVCPAVVGLPRVPKHHHCPIIQGGVAFVGVARNCLGLWRWLQSALDSTNNLRHPELRQPTIRNRFQGLYAS